MEPYLSNKKKEISWKEFEKNLPPQFIKSIEDYLNPKTIHIFENTNSKENYLIETKPCECYLCKKNINFIDMTDKLNTFILNKFNELNESILYKMNNNKIEIPRIHRIFICESKVNSDIYLKYYYHLCNTCFEESLYYWYITHENKYPSTRIDGFCFIHKNDSFVPEIKSEETLKKIKNINFPLKFDCNYYNNIENKYNFMDNE
tara:strand:- start:839 stop:1450 length:612 start_codon:yes stop_codon:yes gene_type:complete